MRKLGPILVILAAILLAVNARLEARAAEAVLADYYLGFTR